MKGDRWEREKLINKGLRERSGGRKMRARLLNDFDTNQVNKGGGYLHEQLPDKRAVLWPLL